MKSYSISNLTLLVLAFLLSACSKKPDSVFTEDINDSSTNITSDYREPYKGYFLVNIHTYVINNGQLTYDKTVENVKVLFDYEVSDSVAYYSKGKVTQKLPAINMLVQDSVDIKIQGYDKNHKWGIIDGASAELIFSQSNPTCTASMLQNSGGYIGLDSINVEYKYNDPHFAQYYKLTGKRLK